MAKPSKTSTEPATKGRLMVVDQAGRRTRFLRGMITHDLVRHGLSFDDAYAAAQWVRDALAGESEVSTVELWARMQAVVAERLDQSLPDRPLEVRARVKVVRGDQVHPFSRGLLARSMQAAGLDLGRAYELVAQVEQEMVERGIESLTGDELVVLAAETMASAVGEAAARRFRLVRSLDRLPRPTVVYVGGATGTGKSTFALELAPLLRIYRINATDTIRQVMRTIFSPQMMPALHGSSFEAPFDLVVDEPVSDEQIEAAFEEQARQVAVGVRAMVERAINEHVSVVIEGIHLVPPLVPFADLEGAVSQIPLMLGTRDAEAHRSRFLSRGGRGHRRAHRYLEHFHAIRLIHDLLLDRADAHDVPLIDTSREDEPARHAVQVVAEQLARQVPDIVPVDQPTTEPCLMLVIDGLADRPVRALGGRTPLEAASTPTLDRLAAEGCCGLADPVTPGFVPDTAAGTLALFGQSPQAMSRGPVEALGAGVSLRVGDLALRGNFASLDDSGNVTDRRAGRIRGEHAEELAAALDRLRLPGSLADDLEVLVAPATEHRLAIVLRGDGLSAEITGSDPGDGAPPGPPLVPAPNHANHPRAVWTAGALAVFEQEARRVLAGHKINKKRKRKGHAVANALLTRGAGHLHRLVPLERGGEKLDVVCVGGDRTVLGIASWLGARIVTQPGMTANLDTDIALKLKAAVRAMDKADLVVVHLKGADIAAHDQRPDLKVAFLEQVDRALADLVDRCKDRWRLAVAGDHATLSESGQHAADPLPVLLWGAGVAADEVEAYGERAAVAGRMGRFPLQLLVGRLVDRSASR